MSDASEFNLEQYNPDTEANGQDETEELPELSDYGRRFVENLPEEDRGKAEQWVRQWDGGYKKQVSKYEEQIQQYRQLGNIEDVQAGTRLYQLLVTNPERVLHYLTEDPNGPKLTPKQAAAQMQKIEDDGAPSNTKPDPNAERLEKLERALLAIAQRDEQRTQAQQQERDQQMFVSALEEARKRLGDFDNQYVAYLLATQKAQTIDEAVKQYHSVVGKPQPRRAAPNLLGTSSAAPSGAKKPDWGQASDKEIKDHLVHLLTAGND